MKTTTATKFRCAAAGDESYVLDEMPEGPWTIINERTGKVVWSCVCQTADVAIREAELDGFEVVSAIAPPAPPAPPTVEPLVSGGVYILRVPDELAQKNRDLIADELRGYAERYDIHFILIPRSCEVSGSATVQPMREYWLARQRAYAARLAEDSYRTPILGEQKHQCNCCGARTDDVTDALVHANECPVGQVLHSLMQLRKLEAESSLAPPAVSQELKGEDALYANAERKPVAEGFIERAWASAGAARGSGAEAPVQHGTATVVGEPAAKRAGRESLPALSSSESCSLPGCAHAGKGGAR
jgi:hypothetical protein